MAVRRNMLESGRQNWATPPDVYAWLDAAFRFTIDVCAEPWSAKHRRYWTKEDNALRQDWTGEIAFDNPEYVQTPLFLEKGKEAAKEGGTSVHLVPSRVDTDWWREATEKNNGKLRGSYYHQLSRVWWLVFSEIVVGFYHHDQRIPFELPPAEREALIKAGKSVDNGAVFPSSVIIYDPPIWRKRLGPKVPRYLESRAAEKKFGRPLLTLGRPR